MPDAQSSQALVFAPPSYTRMLGLLLRREFLIERRTFGWAASMGLLALQEVVILGLGFSSVQKGPTKQTLAVAALWLAFLFAGAMGMNRTFAQERDQGALAGLLLLPFDRGLLYLAKVIAGMVFLTTALVVMLGAAGIFLDLPAGQAGMRLAPVLVLTALGYVAAGTLVAAMTSSLRGRDALLAIALLPIVIPLFVAATSAARDVVLGAEIADIQDQLMMLAAFDAIYLALGLLLFEKVIEA